MLLINNYKARREVVHVQTTKTLTLKSLFVEEEQKVIIVYLLSQGFVHCPFWSAIHTGTEAKAIKNRERSDTESQLFASFPCFKLFPTELKRYLTFRAASDYCWVVKPELRKNGGKNEWGIWQKQWSSNHRIMEWLGSEETFMNIPIPAKDRDNFHHPRLLWALSNLAWDTTMDGTATASLGNLFQWSSTRPFRKWIK